MGPEEFRAAGHELIDWIADYRTRIPELPVQAQVVPGEVAGKLPHNAPEEAEPFSRLLADLESIVVPGVTQVQHPRYFGWFPANATLSSALGDLASAGIGALGITWQSAPALTEVEEVVVEWLRELTGLPGSWKGVIQDTASTACLVALLVARERATDYSEVRGGLQAESAPLTVYTTEHAHSSVVKAVALAGYGRDNLRLVAVDPVTYAMRPDELAKALEEDVTAGRRPAAVVVSVGGLLDNFDLVDLARANSGRILVPTGALIGLDAVNAAAVGTIHSVRMVTRKPIDGLKGAPFIVQNNIDIGSLREPLKLLEGTAREAARGFPANLNVAVALSLAGVGPDRTSVQIWADPTVTRNVHRIEVESDSARFSMSISCTRMARPS